MIMTRIGAFIATCLVAGTAFASTSTPDSYSMLNGNTGSYNYWDDTYTGAGCLTCDNAALSGGRGDLTDGIIANNNWFVTEAPGHGPYVGWALDPTINFHWNSSVNVSSVTFHMDDADGAGGVSTPAAIIINGITYNVTDPLGSAPFSFTASGLTFSGTDMVVTIQRNNAWVFVSEVQFNAAPVPEPASAAMLLAGLGLMGALTLRRKAG